MIVFSSLMNVHRGSAFSSFTSVIVQLYVIILYNNFIYRARYEVVIYNKMISAI